MSTETASEAAALPRKTVLLVDDEPKVTETLRVSLRKEPYRVLTANLAREGLEILEAEKVDVVVSDERMPEMSGSEFLSVVRERYPAVMRIILTGESSMDAAIKAINDAAIFRFLRKPIAAADLSLVIAEAMDAQATQQRLASVAEDLPTELDSQLLEAAMQSLWIAFQPLVAVPSRRTMAFEALLRTSHPGIENAEHFLGLAQRVGRMRDLEHRIHEAIAQSAGAAREDVLFFVNIHPESLDDPELYECDYPLCEIAERVVIEVTERASLSTISDVPQKVDALRARGYRIAIDDLGAGYSGLTSFAELQPEFVKFDMELVRGIQHSSTKSKLIASMTALCKELQIQTIAEGVETREERDRLVELGCDILQGYYHGRPGKPFAEGLWKGTNEH